jgi:DNA polymerase iota
MEAALSRDDQRIILHFVSITAPFYPFFFFSLTMQDYDCFYASVFEVEQPVLKTLPLAVQQKQIVVTCNYEARRRGLHKLQLIKEAKKVCPDVVIVLGEDLTKFRDASKDLYLFLRGFIWGERVEKLGFDEIFMDVTDMIAYNVALLNPNDLTHSFFHLDRQDPTAGFEFDATNLHGPVYPDGDTAADLAPSTESDPSQIRTRLLLASHLAGYLRGQLEDEKGYTATAGISTSKILAKLVGSVHKPNSQTTLLPPYTTVKNGEESNVLKFLDQREIRAIPGIGSKFSRKIISYITASDPAKAEDGLTVRDVRLFPGMGPSVLERILSGPGAPRAIGLRIWELLHGVDNTPVGEARDVPTQISIEDSYGSLDNFEAARKAMLALAASLIRRMRTDLTEKYTDAETTSTTAAEHGDTKIRWLARPRTIRLSTLPRSLPDSNSGVSHTRISHSAPLPQYVFNLDESVDALAERLVRDLTVTMFRKLHRERTGWNLRVLNLAVTNMIDLIGKHSNGCDIGKMFQRQEVRHQESHMDFESGLVTDLEVPESTPAAASEAVWEESDEEDNMTGVHCNVCGALIPHFARVAHEVYHTNPGQ